MEAKNGAKIGTEGQSRRMEAVQVAIVPKGAKAPSANCKDAAQANAKAFVK